MKFLPKFLTALLMVCYVTLGIEIAIIMPLLLIVFIPFAFVHLINEVNEHILNH